MNLSDIRTHLDYHYWARDRVLDSAALLSAQQWTQEMECSFRSVRGTLVHIYGAEVNWALRLEGQSPTAMVSPDGYADAASLRADWVTHEAKLRGLVEAAGEEGLEQVYHYRTLTGLDMSSTLAEILLHTVNHASYHRGQVTTLLRQLGAAPAKPTDLIAFYRKRAIENERVAP
jgi:uncharacterized damage-inducible protein DinB